MSLNCDLVAPGTLGTQGEAGTAVIALVEINLARELSHTLNE